MADTGIGIEPEVLPRIFDPFEQGETTITREFGGLGLGLAICRGIVEAHGGTIVAESGGKGRGATFRVVLTALPEPAVGGDGEPVGGVAGVDRRRPVAAPHPGGGGRAGDACGSWRGCCGGSATRSTTAGTIASALRGVEAGEFDLVISDIGLPDGSGLDLMRRVVARRGRSRRSP